MTEKKPTTKFRRPDGRPGTIDPYEGISRKLREYYQSVKDEEIPDRFLDLLEQLEQVERAERNADDGGGEKR